jgi:tripartite-type tricarboxylate transporter receptor subunit TctC
MRMFRTLCAALLVLTGFQFAGSTPSLAQAQDYPNKEIHMIVGFAAGSGADLLARYVTQRLSEKAGKPIIVENKPGATATIGAQAASLAKPDGYTLLFTGSSTHATAPALYKKLAFDPVKDFTPITTIQKLAFVLTVDAKSPIKSVADLTTFLRKKDKPSYGTSNTTALAASELYKSATGIDVVRVNYKATQEGVRDMLAGFVDFMFIDAGFAMAQEKAGNLRVLATTTAERIGIAPNLPTMAESGFPGFELTPWWAVYGPAGLPQPIVERLANWINEIVGSEETKQFFAETGAVPFLGNAKILNDFQIAEIEKWGKIFRAAGVQPE